jgi:hypothetical protein
MKVFYKVFAAAKSVWQSEAVIRISKPYTPVTQGGRDMFMHMESIKTNVSHTTLLPSYLHPQNFSLKNFFLLFIITSIQILSFSSLSLTPNPNLTLQFNPT